MKTVLNLCVALIYFLGALTISFRISLVEEPQFLIASEKGYLFHYIVIAIALICGFVANFISKNQLLGIGLYLTILPFSMYGNNNFVQHIILDNQPIVGISLFLVGISVLVFRKTILRNKIEASDCN